MVRTTIGERRKDGTINYREYTRPVAKLCVLLTEEDETSFVGDKTGEVCAARDEEEASKE